MAGVLVRTCEPLAGRAKVELGPELPPLAGWTQSGAPDRVPRLGSVPRMSIYALRHRLPG
jgi:hypothetical protein